MKQPGDTKFSLTLRVEAHLQFSNIVCCANKYHVFSLDLRRQIIIFFTLGTVRLVCLVSGVFFSN